MSLRALTQKAAAAGLTNRGNGKPLVRAKIHQLLQNPIYFGDFMWLDRMYEGQHKPLISRDLFERVSAGIRGGEPSAARHETPAFVRRTCEVRSLRLFVHGRAQEGPYVYYHCIGAKGACGNSYIREEDLGILLGELVKRVRIPTELADAVAKVLLVSQSDKESFVRSTTMRLSSNS